MLNSLQIEYFIAVAENLSFTKAANNLYVTQPAISHQIAKLEKELDVALFNRTNKGIELTAGGELLYDFFKDNKQQLYNLKKEAKSLNGNEINDISLGCLEGWNITSFFPKILREIETRYPGVELSMECYDTKELVSALLNNDLDAIITLDVTLGDISGLNSEILCEVDQLLLYSSYHYLAKKENLKPYDFRNEYFYTLKSSEASFAKDLVISYCKPYGFIPKIKTVRNFDSIYICVQNGMGVAIVNSLVRVKDNIDFSYIKLDDTFSISFAYRTNDERKGLHILKNEMKFLLSKEANDKYRFENSEAQSKEDSTNDDQILD